MGYSNESMIKHDKIANKNLTWLDQCPRHRVSLEVTILLNCYLLYCQTILGTHCASHFCESIRDKGQFCFQPSLAIHKQGNNMCSLFLPTFKAYLIPYTCQLIEDLEHPWNIGKQKKKTNNVPT